MTDDICPLCEERPTGEQVDACADCADDAIDREPADSGGRYESETLREMGLGR